MYYGCIANQIIKNRYKDDEVKAVRKLILIALILSVALCLSAQASVRFSVSPAELNPGEKGAVKAVVTIPETMHQSYFPGDEDYFFLKASAAGLEFGKTRYPTPDKIEEGDEWIYSGSVTLSLPFTVKSSVQPGNITIKAEAGTNVCLDTGMCNPPESVESNLTLKILSIETAPVQVEEEVADTVAAVQEVTETPVEPEPVESKSSAGDIWKYMLFAFLGGLILNATPCVLPILPIRIMKIIHQAKTDDSQVLTHVFVYTFGVLISFGIMAGIIIALQQAGESVGWGLQNQNPGFVIALMCIVFAFALSLLGVFEINPPGLNKVSQATSKGGYGGSFFGGIFAFLMAISCTGPFLGLALPFALKFPPLLLLTFFLVIGLGFSSPFIIIGFFKGALKFIPKPGDWMVIFKQVMGFVLLWIVYTQLKTLLVLTDGAYFMKVLWFMLILGFAIWLYGRFVRYEHSKTTQWVFTILPVLLIIAAALFYLPMDAETHTAQAVTVEGLMPAAHTPQGWYVFNEKLLNDTLAEGRSVFLDVGAEWCKNCKTNEKTVLFTQSMMQEFNAKNVLLLKADFTKKDPVLLAWIKKHDRAGVPFNALYIPEQQPIIFNELISKNEIMDALNKIPE